MRNHTHLILILCLFGIIGTNSYFINETDTETEPQTQHQNIWYKHIYTSSTIIVLQCMYLVYHLPAPQVLAN